MNHHSDSDASHRLQGGNNEPGSAGPICIRRHLSFYLQVLKKRFQMSDNSFSQWLNTSCWTWTSQEHFSVPGVTVLGWTQNQRPESHGGHFPLTSCSGWGNPNATGAAVFEAACCINRRNRETLQGRLTACHVKKLMLAFSHFLANTVFVPGT